MALMVEVQMEEEGKTTIIILLQGRPRIGLADSGLLMGRIGGLPLGLDRLVRNFGSEDSRRQGMSGWGSYLHSVLALMMWRCWIKG